MFGITKSITILHPDNNNKNGKFIKYIIIKTTK